MHGIAQSGLELAVDTWLMSTLPLLFQSSKYWDYRHGQHRLS